MYFLIIVTVSWYPILLILFKHLKIAWFAGGPCIYSFQHNMVIFLSNPMSSIPEQALCIQRCTVRRTEVRDTCKCEGTPFVLMRMFYGWLFLDLRLRRVIQLCDYCASVCFGWNSSTVREQDSHVLTGIRPNMSLYHWNKACIMYIYIYTHICGPGSSVGIAIELRAGRSGIESRWGWDFPPVQTGLGAHSASCKMGTGSFSGVKCGRGVLLTTSSAGAMEE